jgi:carbonic anhydrase
MKKIAYLSALTLFAICTVAQEKHHAPHWSYEGTNGPEHWAEMSPEFATCKNGHVQSPINITGASEGKLPSIEFHYQPATLKLIDNGHTIQVNYAPGSFIKVGEKRYELVQFHFHHPSEEQIEGKSHDMVVHLVHQDADGQKAVVAVLLDQGKDNPAIQTIFNRFPSTKDKEVTTDATINAADLLPSDHTYYTFEGSLTTPPCSEGVTWFVMKNPATLTSAEAEHFAALYPHNARPVQPVNGRKILVGQ